MKEAIIIKSPREIALIRESAKIIVELFGYLKTLTKPGISTWEIDKLAEKFIRSHGGIPSSKGYEGFPGAICISVNDTLIHGIPSKKIILKEGDIVSYDILVTKNGYTADAARTFGVGEISKEAEELIRVTRECFFKGVKRVKPNAHIGDISYEIEKHARSYGYGLTDMFGGHGVGKEVHEEPLIPNVGEEGIGTRLKKGMTIAIEPMVNIGGDEVMILDDDWTVKTVDHSLCAHYENTVVVTDTGYEILTLEEGKEN